MKTSFIAFVLLTSLYFVVTASQAGLPPTNQVIKYERYDSEKKWREVSKTDGDLILSCLSGIDSFKTWGSTVPRGQEALPIPAALGFRIVSISGTTNVIYLSSRGQLVECPIRGLLVVPDDEESILAQVLAQWREADNKRITSQPLPCQYRIGSADDGNTLSGIARLFYGDATKWLKIYDENKAVLKNPDIIQDGNIITIPKLNE